MLSQEYAEQVLLTLQHASADADAQYVAEYTVGRADVIKSIVSDLLRIERKAGSFRLISADYGQGKSHLLALASKAAQNAGYATMSVSLSQNETLIGPRAQSTFFALMRSLKLPQLQNGKVIKKSETLWDLRDLLKYLADWDNQDLYSKEWWEELVEDMYKCPTGLTVAGILNGVWDNYRHNRNGMLYLRWFYQRTKASEYNRSDFISDVPTSSNYLDVLQAFAIFLHKAGYRGLLVILDEGASLAKISQNKMRIAAYDRLFEIYNRCSSNQMQYISVLFTYPQPLLEDSRRGLASVPDIHSRLSTSSSRASVLQELSPEDRQYLMIRIVEIFNAANGTEISTDEDQIIQIYNNFNFEVLTLRDLIQIWLKILTQLTSGSGEVDIQNLTNKSHTDNPETYTQDTDELYDDIDSLADEVTTDMFNDGAF